MLDNVFCFGLVPSSPQEVTVDHMTSSEDYIVQWTSGNSSSATADYVTVFWCWGNMNRTNVHCKVSENCSPAFVVVASHLCSLWWRHVFALFLFVVVLFVFMRERERGGWGGGGGG